MKKYQLLAYAVAVLLIPAFGYCQQPGNVLIDNGPDASAPAVDETEETMDDNAQNSEMGMDNPSMNAMEENTAGEEDENAGAPQALAIIEGTADDSDLYGEVELTQTSEGVQVNAEVYNAPPGKHGFHVHENNSCDDKGNAAGGHFNPEGVQHGFVPKDGMQGAHAGDMGNIEINEEGEGTLSLLLPGLSLTEGKDNVSGKAIILHEKEDDFGQPTGNAGSRIGCGVIELVTEE